GGAARATSSTSATKDHDHHDHHQRQERSTKRQAIIAADFVRVVRALLWLSPPPRQAASAASETAAELTGTVRIAEVDAIATAAVVAATAQQNEEGGLTEDLGDRNQAKRWEPRTALDFSGHSFGKDIQVR
ncbi:unnamed protein product, partial [Hapterophycus canaliculatus]